VFRFNPPSVGFAALSNLAKAQNGANGPAPSATIGSAAATVSATQLPRRVNGAVSPRSMGWGMMVIMMAWIGVMVL